MKMEDPPATAAELELRSAERRLQLELAQQRRREGSLVLRLAVKDREAREAREALQRCTRTPEHTQMETLMLDPAVNAEIRKLREDVRETLIAPAGGQPTADHASHCVPRR